MSGDRSDAIDSITYDADRGVYSATFDRRSVEPSMAVVDVVSRVTDVDPTRLEPLYDAIDPDSLDRLTSKNGPGIASGGDSEPRPDSLYVEFAYAGFRIRVERIGRIELRPRSSDTGNP